VVKPAGYQAHPYTPRPSSLALVPLKLKSSRSLKGRPLLAPQMAPSRQERRTAERAAAKRAPSKAGAAGSAGAAAARATVNSVGDWRTQRSDPKALLDELGLEGLMQKADKAGGLLRLGYIPY